MQLIPMRFASSQQRIKTGCLGVIGNVQQLRKPLVKITGAPKEIKAVGQPGFLGAPVQSAIHKHDHIVMIEPATPLIRSKFGKKQQTQSGLRQQKFCASKLFRLKCRDLDQGHTILTGQPRLIIQCWYQSRLLTPIAGVFGCDQNWQHAVFTAKYPVTIELFFWLLPVIAICCVWLIMFWDMFR